MRACMCVCVRARVSVCVCVGGCGCVCEMTENNIFNIYKSLKTYL